MQRSLGNFDIGTAQYQYWLLQVSIFGKFPKMPYKMLSIGKYFGHYRNFVYFPHWVWQHVLSVLQFGKFLLFPHIFGSSAVKAVAFIEISSF